MTIQDFINQHNNQFLDFDGAYGAQCVDLVQFWSQAIGGPRFSGDAVDIAGQTLGFYSWVPNSPTGVPPAGAIVVWGQYAPHGIGSAGHIATATGDGDANSFNSFDQNWPEGSPCHVQHHDYGGVLGWLVALNNSGGDEVATIQNQDNWYARCNRTHQLIRGRDLDRNTFNAFVGQDFLHFVEACEDDPEADTVQNWQNIGQIAVRDNWQQQIYTLEAQLTDAQKQLQAITTDDQTVTAANKQLQSSIATLQDQLQEARQSLQQAPAPSTPVAPTSQSTSPDNTITITKDGLWAKIKSFLSKLGV